MRFVGALIPPVALALGANIPASEVTRAVIMVSLVMSGALINRWWAPAPAIVSWAALALAEEANHWGFGPGTRIGTAIEIHSGGAFSLSFFALTMVIAIALPSLGLAVRRIAPVRQPEAAG